MLIKGGVAGDCPRGGTAPAFVPGAASALRPTSTSFGMRFGSVSDASTVGRFQDGVPSRRRKLHE